MHGHRTTLHATRARFDALRARLDGGHERSCVGREMWSDADATLQPGRDRMRPIARGG